MGRWKIDRFKSGYLSDKTIKAIMADISQNAEIDPAEYDWDILEIRVRRADKAQRHRFADTIRKLKAFTEGQDALLCFDEVHTDAGLCEDYVISIRHFAEITGRNRETVMDWVDKGFLSYCTVKGYRTFILVERSIKKMEEISNGFSNNNRTNNWTNTDQCYPKYLDLSIIKRERLGKRSAILHQ